MVPLAATVGISPSNQSAVARATVDGGLAVGQAQVLDTTNRATAQSVGTTGASRGQMALIEKIVWTALSGSPDPRRTVQSASARPAAVITVDSSMCNAGGSTTLTLDDRDGNGIISVGETLTATFTQCRDTASELINGVATLTVGSFSSPAPSTVSFSGTLTFQQINAQQGQTSATIGGTVSFSATLNVATGSLQLSLTVGSAGLTVNESSTGYTDTITYDAGMQITLNDTGGTSTETVNGTLTATSLGGRVNVSTPQALIQLSTDANPSSGQVLVTGTGGSALRVTVLDNTQVRLDVDANGDGTYEASTTVPWSSLL